VTTPEFSYDTPQAKSTEVREPRGKMKNSGMTRDEAFAILSDAIAKRHVGGTTRTLVLLDRHMDPRRPTMPFELIWDSYDWLWTDLSTTRAADGASPFFYWGPSDTRVVPDSWTDFEIDEFAWLHGKQRIDFELTDSEYEQIIARIESRQVFYPSRRTVPRAPASGTTATTA